MPLRDTLQRVETGHEQAASRDASNDIVVKLFRRMKALQ